VVEPRHPQPLLAFDSLMHLPAMVAKDLGHQLAIERIIVNYQSSSHARFPSLSAPS
jgi:hypothetical protein